MLVFKGRLTPEDGAVFLKAMEAWFDVVNRNDNENHLKNVPAETSPVEDTEPAQNVSAETSAGEDPENTQNLSAETSVPELPEPNYAQKRADALMLMAEHSLNDLTEDSKPLSNPEKCQIIVHLEPGHLQDRPQVQIKPFSCSVESGAGQFPLSSTTARRLACDASLVPVLEDGEGNVIVFDLRFSVAIPGGYQPWRNKHLQ